MARRIEVELDIFSGMPNPSWTLTDAEGDELARQLSALQRTEAGELSGHLGYRGFILRVSGGASMQTIHVQRGLVRFSSGTATSYARDEERALERRLVATGKPHLSEELFSMLDRNVR
jgi:hypothetical protein